MATNGRQAVKKRLLTRQETLQRLRDECTDRMSKDKESLKQELRGSLNRGIRESTFVIDEADIDSLIDDFFKVYPMEEIADVEDDIGDEDGWRPGMLKCPLCCSGWLLEPFLNIVTCDGCAEMCLNVGLADLGMTLDFVIRQHSAVCAKPNLQFNVANKILYSSCPNCGLHGPVVQS